jgi:tetratricopeptide (TPR) repeat protein
MPTSIAIQARQWLARSLAELGQFEPALTIVREISQMAEQAGQTHSRSAASWGLASCLNLRGEFHQSIPGLERAVSTAQALDAGMSFILHAMGLGQAYVLTGRVADGIALLEASRDKAASLGAQADQSRRHTYLSEACRLIGCLDDAAEHAALALDLARTNEEVSNEAYALLALARVAADRGSAMVEQGEAHYREALAIAAELEMRPLQAHCHLGLGKLYRQTGRLDEARTELGTAVEMLSEMGMTFWLPEAEAELAAVVGVAP